MAITAAVTLTATVTGAPEGGSNSVSVSASNTSAVGTIQVIGVTTALAAAVPVVVPTSGSMFMVQASGGSPYRITNSTSETGIPCSTLVPTLLSITGGSTVYVYTTATSTFGARVTIW